MPQFDATTDVVFFMEDDRTVRGLDTGSELYRSNRKAFANCTAKIGCLRMFGHELPARTVDYLRDGIYELAGRNGTVQYRICFSSHGRQHGGPGPRADQGSTIPEGHRACERKEETL